MMNIRFRTIKVMSVNMLLAQVAPVCLIAIADDLIPYAPAEISRPIFPDPSIDSRLC